MKNPLYLIGMMGCGKSSVGSRLAEILQVSFVDLDSLIEEQAKMPISDIFARFGEEGFRMRETAALRSISTQPSVIATGGGIITREENIRIMQETGLVIWLQRPLERILADIPDSGRPLLAGNKKERLYALYNQRKSLYARAAGIIFESLDTVDATATALSRRPEIISPSGSTEKKD